MSTFIHPECISGEIVGFKVPETATPGQSKLRFKLPKSTTMDVFDQLTMATATIQSIKPPKLSNKILESATNGLSSMKADKLYAVTVPQDHPKGRQLGVQVRADP